MATAEKGWFEKTQKKAANSYSTPYIPTHFITSIYAPKYLGYLHVRSVWDDFIYVWFMFLVVH